MESLSVRVRAEKKTLSISLGQEGRIMADLGCSRVDYDNALFPELNEYLAASPKVHKGKPIVTYRHKEDEEGKSINVTYKHKEEEEQLRSTCMCMYLSTLMSWANISLKSERQTHSRQTHIS
nr:hypothetical protein CFP56_39768 [Quercus suber]